MNCELELVEARDGRYLLRCKKCGEEVLSRYADPSMRQQKCDGKPKPKGPGIELRRVFHVLGIKPAKNCKCKQFAAWMDKLGVEGCRTQRVEIADKLQAKSKEFGLAAFFAGGWRAITTGLARRINPLHPFLSFVDLAIERAEQADRRG